MPKKVLPSPADFAGFEFLMRAYDFVSISKSEVAKDIIRFGAIPPSPRRGREAGFKFSENNLTVKVWTTWIREDGKAREIDAGWVLILQDDEPVYFARPVHRTKNFFINLFRKAWLARWRVKNRPLCPECKQFMRIVYGRNLKSRYWRCDNRSLHQDKKSTRRGWDEGLPPKALDLVTGDRKRRRLQTAKAKKDGREVTPRVLLRHSWRKTRPPHGAS